MNPRVIDLSTTRKNPPDVPPGGEPKYSLKNGKVLVRDPKKITTIGIHQMACVFGPANDREKAFLRALNIPAHACAYDGVIVTPIPLLWYAYHGNGMNAYSLGLEIEGHYAGKLDDPNTIAKREDLASMSDGKEPTPWTDLRRDTACAAVKLLVDGGRALGCPIEFIEAHRQHHAGKPSDPGAMIWKTVVLDYAVPVLGLKVRNDRVTTMSKGSGRPIPKDWDPSSPHAY